VNVVVTCDEVPNNSIRLPPRITADSVRLVWAAAPRLLIVSIVLKLLNGAGIAATLMFSRDLISSVLAADSQKPGIGTVAPLDVIQINAGVGDAPAA
jgi:hypothetical protein